MFFFLLSITSISFANSKRSDYETVTFVTAKTAPAQPEKPSSYRQKIEGLSIYADYLYFNVVQDSIRYAQKIPQTDVPNAVIQSIDQPASWQSGFRVGLQSPSFYHYLFFALNFTYFNISPNQVRKSDENFGIFTTLTTPAYGIVGNFYAQEVIGKWDLKFYVIDFEMKFRTEIKNILSLSPIIGVKYANIKQSIFTRYNNIMINAEIANTPQVTDQDNFVHGIGPAIGVDFGFILPQNWSIFSREIFSCLFGHFDLSTTYKELLFSPPGSSIAFKGNQNNFFFFAQLQAGIQKNFKIQKNLDLAMAAGWEAQLWFRQLRTNWMGTIVVPPNGSDLVLQGPFFRLSLSF